MLSKISLKPYPCCGEATAAVEAAIRLSGVLEQAPESIKVRLGPFAREMLEFDLPTTAEQARFSATYCVATALERGNLTMDAFSATALSSPVILEYIRRTTVEVVPEWGHRPCAEVVIGAGNDVFTSLVEVPDGHPSTGLSSSKRHMKFVSCVAPILGERQTDALFVSLLNVPSTENLDDLFGLVGMPSGE
jgi:2-methylcitrate dehydratase PrpD